MSTLILKRLRQSELGLFEICRRLGRETGRQRGLNLDATVMEQVFRPGDAEALFLQTRWFDGTDIVDDTRPLRLQQKNWRLTGEAVRSDRFEYVKPDDIVLFWYQQGAVAGLPDVLGTLTWDVISQNDRTTLALFRRCSVELEGASACVVSESQAAHIMRLARRRLQVFGGDPNTDTAGLSDDDWDSTINWFAEWFKDTELRALQKTGIGPATTEVLKKLGERSRASKGEDLACEVLRQFGSELLARPDRRELLVKVRFRHNKAGAPELPGKWYKGGKAAVEFVRALGLPTVMAGNAVATAEDFEDIDAFQPLGPLHEFQKQIAEGIKEVLQAPLWNHRRGIVWLPTGCGKTRVMVESLLDFGLLEAPRNCLLWIADREELCEQAVETFRHVWMVKGMRTQTALQGGQPTLRVMRLWGGREWKDPPIHPTVIIASIQTLAKKLEEESFEEELAILADRLAGIVFDEAHHVVAPSYGRVIQALGLTSKPNYLGRKQNTAPPLFGLTATPARANDDETEQLSRRFHGRLIEPGDDLRSLKGFQDAGYLSHVVTATVATGYSLHLTDADQIQLEKFQTIPSAAIRRAGEDTARTAAIIRDLEKRLPKLSSVLVFACSVEHSTTMAEVLTKRGYRAAHLDGKTPRAVRWHVIQQFRNKHIQVLVNCDLLATGFDAPNIDAIVIARPISSRVLFTQIVGRGLRGPKNGGTSRCLLIDYQDNASALGDLEQLRESFRQEFLALK